MLPTEHLHPQLRQTQTAVATVAPPSRPDRTDTFWSLFSAWNFLQAEPPAAGKKPDWKAVKAYPLAQRLASRGKLIAVRPQTKTHFLTIDIDATSRNHFNQQNVYAVARLQAALEERLGLVEPIVIRSSDSGGFHLWYWFEDAQNAYQLAAAVAIVLKEAGFVLQPGHLETFPNCKAWIDSENPADWSHYQAIRVPFQEPGSYLLDPDNYYAPLLHLHADQRQEFLRLVQYSQRRNALTSTQIAAVLATRPQPLKHVSVSGNQYLSDLLAKVRDGWTGQGQTNQLFFDTTRLLRVFGHLLLGVAPFWETERLADAILAYILELPGREQFCAHNHELEAMAWDWAKWVQGSKYKPYEPNHRRVETVTKELEQDELLYNERQRQLARERITNGVRQLLNQSQLPATINARRDALEALGLNRKTLYRHRDLWHPAHLTETLKPLASGGVTPMAGNIDPSEPLKPIPGGEVTPIAHKVLVPHPAALREQAERQQEAGGSGGFSTGEAGAAATGLPDTSSPSLPPASQGMTGEAGAVLNATIARAQQQRQRQRQAATLARMTQWLESDDPILIAEAARWFAARESDPGSLIQEVTTNSQKQPHSDFVAGRQPPKPQPPTPKPERLATDQRADYSPPQQTAGEAATRDGYDAVFDQLASNRIQLNKTVRQTLLASPLERVQLAVAAVLEYLQRLEAKGDRPKQTKEAILVKALKDGWTPKGQAEVATSASRTAPSGFREWYKLAHAVGLVSAAQMQDGVQLVLTSRGEWEPWESFVVAFPLAELHEMAQARRS